MNSRCTFLLQYFGERHILLKDEWLNATIDFIHNRVPQSVGFSDDQFANLVLEQWTCSDISSTSFPVFGNYGIDKTVPKQNLQGPIVCQVNGFIDVGSPYYQQYCNLNKTGKKEDHSGFDEVFHEKEDDSDQKSSRLLKLTLTDGESSLTAIEFWKCPHLSLYCKPGVKIYIAPPCVIRKGVFLLKPTNCKLLGGEIPSLLQAHRPMIQYAKLLGIKDANVGPIAKPPCVPALQERKPENSIVVSSNQQSSAPGPSALIKRYLTAQPKPSTSKPPNDREISPDIFASGDENEEMVYENDNENNVADYGISPSTSRKPIETSVCVSSLLNRKNVDEENWETGLHHQKSPKKRNSTSTLSPTFEPPRRASGMLTSRRIDPMDEILENMIEKDEEPVSCPVKTKKSNIFAVKYQPPMKKVKIEPDSDDDIQVIELVTPPPPVKNEKHLAKRIEDSEERCVEEKEVEEGTCSAEEKAALEAFSKLRISSLNESLKKMKYSIGSKRFSLLAIIEDIVEPLRVVDSLWTMKVNLQDDSGQTGAFIDNDTLQNLIGYSCEEAMAIRKSSDVEKRLDGKKRLDALQQQIERLDLVFEVEFYAGSCPVVRSMKTLAEQIDFY